jgi:hypothetical protein
MKFSFHPSAVIELNEGVDYYESCQTGLGAAFTDEVRAAIHRILEHPKAWALLSKNTRRCLTNRFPFGVVYQIVEDGIFILAVMHLNRRPDYWQSREEKK